MTKLILKILNTFFKMAAEGQKILNYAWILMELSSPGSPNLPKSLYLTVLKINDIFHFRRKV